MIRKKKLFFITILLSVLLYNTYGQNQILFEQTIPQKFLVEYSANSTPEEVYKNKIINILAKSIGKYPHNCKYTFGFDQMTRVYRNNYDLYVNVNIKNMVVEGDVFYKQFYIGHDLLPSTCQISGQLLNTQNQVIDYFQSDFQAIDPENTTYSFHYQDSSITNNYWFKIQKISFLYTEKSEKSFKYILSIIDEYYDMDARISFAMKDLKQVNIKNYDKIFEYKDLLVSIKNMIINMRQSPVFKDLEINRFDPLLIMKKLADIETITDGLMLSVNETIAVLHEVYYNEGIEALNNNKITDAKTLFNKSKEINPQYSPAWYQLAKIEYDAEHYGNTNLLLIELYKQSAPPPAVSNLIKTLAEKVYYAYLNKANSYLNAQYYAKAIDMYNEALDFCKQIPPLECTNDLYLGIEKAQLGTYHQYIKNAEYALNNNQLDKAWSYIQEAYTYQQAHRKVIPSTDDADIIAQKIRQQRYYEYISFGKDKLKIKDYNGALNWFTKAQNLQYEYSLVPTENLPKLTAQAAKPILLADLNSIQSLIKANSLASAKNKLKTLIENQKIYYLTTDNIINTGIEAAKKELFEQECINAQNEFDLTVRNGKEYLLKNDFINAKNTFKNAVSFAKNNSKCAINTNEIDNEILRITPPATYLEKINDINIKIRRTQYSEAILEYINLMTYYKSNNLASFGLQYDSLHVFIKQSTTSFNRFCVKYYTDKKLYNKALDLLYELKKRNTNKKYVKAEQQNLGIMLAIRDFEKNPNTNYKAEIMQYTKGDKWYKYLKKGYKKQWRKLN